MNISRSKSIMMAVALAGAGVLGMGSSLQAKDGGSTTEVRLRCSVSNRRGPDMNSEWRGMTDGSRTDFKVQVEDLASTAGLTVQVGTYTHAIPEAIAPTPGAANGVAELDITTQDGDNVPTLVKGAQVNVLQNGAGLISCFLN